MNEDTNDAKSDSGMDKPSARYQNIWLISYPEFFAGITHYCLRAFAFLDSENISPMDYIFLFGNIESNLYDIDHIKYLCKLSKFPFKNIIFTKMKYPTLIEDIIYDYNIKHKLENIIINTFNDNNLKYNYCYIHTFSKTPLLNEFKKNLILKYARLQSSYNLLHKYNSHEQCHVVNNDNLNPNYIKYSKLNNFIQISDETEQFITKFGKKSMLHCEYAGIDAHGQMKQVKLSV